ncbi:MAG: NYN domain-containing protein [Candidatus Eisenbacteria bacterium]
MGPNTGRTARIFVDFWNFQLQWNDRTQRAPCDWTRLPRALLARAEHVLSTVGSNTPLLLDESRVYASYDPARPADANLRRWLDSFLDRQPSYRVVSKERRSHASPAHCTACGNEVRECPRCRQPLRQSVEKGVDTAIVTDLLSLAWEQAFDVAILVSSDSDLVPGVERLQERGPKVINATWRGHGHHLAKASWGSFDLDTMVAELTRT